MFLINHLGFAGLSYKPISFELQGYFFQPTGNPITCHVRLVMLVPLFVFGSLITSVINVLAIGEFNIVVKNKLAIMFVHGFMASRNQLHSRMHLFEPILKINFGNKGGIKIS